MSTLIVAAGIAVGTLVALLSLVYLAALSAYRRQAFQDDEDARLWQRRAVPNRPVAAVASIRTARHPRPLRPAACLAIGQSAANPPRRRHPKSRAAR